MSRRINDPYVQYMADPLCKREKQGESLLATQVSIRFFGFRMWQSPFLSESKEVESSDSVAPRAGQLQQRMEK